MIAGLIHRCTISTPAGAPADALGQPAPIGFSVQASGVSCRLLRDDPAATRLLLGAAPGVAAGDRVHDVRDRAGGIVDTGPFAVIKVARQLGRAGTALQRLSLQRLTQIDQE